MMRFLANGRAGSPWVVRVGAAVSIAVGGYVHWCLWRNGYRAIPKIGVLFEMNAIASAVTALAIAVRREPIVRLAGLTLAIGTLVAFGLSRTPRGLFQFQERGLQPSPQAAVALIAELLAVTALLATLVWDVRRDLLTRSARHVVAPSEPPRALSARDRPAPGTRFDSRPTE